MEQRARRFERGQHRAGRPWRILLAALLMAAAALVGCGEAGDDPADCRPGEYFSEANDSCEACPALGESDCRDGCGFSIVEDERGCPAYECAEPCLCDDGEYFAEESFNCEACEEANDPPNICFDDEGDEDDDGDE